MAKIIGVTVGTTTPRPNWSQTNTKKSDFIKNKPEQDLPPVTAADNEKVLQVEDGKWKAKQIADANALVSQHNQAEGAHPLLASAIDEVRTSVNNLDVEGKINKGITAHIQDGLSHNDIRLAVEALEKTLDRFFDVDGDTLDQVSELLAYVKQNEAYLPSKVGKEEIQDNLETPVATVPLSANQGVVLKGLITQAIAQIGTAIEAHNSDGTAHKGLIEAVDDLDTAVTKLTTKVTALENAKPDMSGYVTTEQFESALGAYITDIDNIVGEGIEGTTPALISFTIKGVSYQAEDGMTWEEWVESSYNTGNYYLSGGVLRDDSSNVLDSNGNQQISNDIIKANEAYKRGSYSGGSGN